MSTNIFFDAQALNPGVKIVSGSFKPNGSSAVDNTANTGAGWTVARTGVGAFLVTLDDGYPGILSATATLAMNAAADSKCILGAIDVTTAAGGTVIIRTVTTASAADIAAHANNRIHFCLVLRNTSQTK